MNKLAVILSMLVLSGLVCADKIYKWVDQDGNIHYSAQKPPGQEAQTVKVSKAPKSSSSKNRTDETNDASKIDDKEEQELDAAAKQQLAKADAVNRKKACEDARKNLAALNATINIHRVDEKTGKQVRLTDDQRLAAMKAAQQNIKEYCN